MIKKFSPDITIDEQGILITQPVLNSLYFFTDCLFICDAKHSKQILKAAGNDHQAVLQLIINKTSTQNHLKL